MRKPGSSEKIYFDVLIVAAGSSVRFSSDTPKQLAPLRDLPLYLWSLRTFATHPLSARIVLATNASLIETMHKQMREDPVLSASGKIFEIVEGGKSRQDSVLKGLTALRKLAAGWRTPLSWESSRVIFPAGSLFVMIHDAARPLVSPALIERVWEKRERADAIVPGIMPCDTVKMLGAGQEVSQTLDRAHLRLIQTPQLFKTSVITDLHQRAAQETGGEGAAFDDAILAEQMGLKVLAVDGAPDNMKVTYPGDLELVSHWAGDRHP